MRLDIQTEAQKLAARLNGKGKCSRNVVMWLDQMPRTFSIDSRSAQYYLKHHAKRLVGVYDRGAVSVEQIAEDLAEVMA